MSSIAHTARIVVLLGMALALTLGNGLVQGKWQNRWGVPDSVKAAQQQLTDLPGEFGPWRLHSTSELGEVEQDILQNYGYVAGVYVHNQTGATIRCSVLLGPAGPTSVHTPEICWGSHAYCATGERVALRIPSRSDEFWTTTFRSRDVSNTAVRAVYGWRFADHWQAPEEPRIRFGTQPYLYKLQIAVDGDDKLTRGLAHEFLIDFLPALDSRLL
jgi:hypothetical protein